MRSRTFRTLGAAVALGLCAQVGMAATAAAPPVGAGWWVVLILFPADKPDPAADPQRIRSLAQRCGKFTIYNEPSSKFREFQSGYNVFLIGSFASSRVAEKTKSSLTRCFPNTFLKYGEFVGE